MRKCPRCTSTCLVKNGIHLASQRYRCKQCRFQFTRQVPRGRSPKDKALATLLYTHGMPLKAIARLLGVTPPAVLQWIKPIMGKTQGGQEIEGMKVLDIDEMLLFLNSEKGRQRCRTLVLAFEVESLTDSMGILFHPFAGKVADPPGSDVLP